MSGPPIDRPLHVHRQVLLVVGVGALTSTVRWLEMLAVGVFVFDRTGSAFLVALMAMLRMLPLALFGALYGALAERVGRTPLLLAGLGAMAALAALLAVLAAGDSLTLWHVAVGALASGVFWAGDFPVRRTLLGDVVPARRLAAAIGADVLTTNGSRVIGPLLGGALLQAAGIGGAFALSAIAYCACIALVALLGHRDEARPGHVGVLTSLAEGLRYLAGQRTLTGLLAVTVIFNLFGFPFLSMVPVIGREALRLDASAIGLLAGLEGAGVLLGACALMLRSPVRWHRRIYVGGVAIYLAAALAFALAPTAAPAGAALLATGLAGAGFSTMQSTLIMLCAEPAARTRMMGVLSVCVGTAPLGLLHLGWLADALGAATAIEVMAAEGLVALALVARAWPEVLAPQPAS